LSYHFYNIGKKHAVANVRKMEVDLGLV